MNTFRRPMFRGGGKIESRGTGITSGLMDGGRVGYQNAGVVTGGNLLKNVNTRFDPFYQNYLGIYNQLYVIL